MNIIAYEPVTVASEGLLLDLLIWRRFKRPMEGLLEALLDLPANQHLEGAGAVLAPGTVVVIPIPQDRERTTAPIASLWD